MREHQIVINLKREQFEEVQRLARLAGNKSVGAYLKNKVLTLLGLDENEGDEPQQMFSPDAHELKDINQELARMHRELQVFIAESLSSTIYTGEVEQDETDEMDEVFDAHMHLQKAMEQDIEYLRSYPGDTVDSAPVDPYPIEQQPPPFKPKQAPAQSPVSQNSPSMNLPDAIEPGAWSGFPTTSFVDSPGVYTNSAAESIWLTPPGQALPQGLQGTAGGDKPRSDLVQPEDELEDLAERAFAISPRLGTLNSTPSTQPAGFRKRQEADPLDDLIDDSILQEAERLRRQSITEEATTYEDGVVYAFDNDEAADQELEERAAAQESTPAEADSDQDPPSALKNERSQAVSVQESEEPTVEEGSPPQSEDERQQDATGESLETVNPSDDEDNSSGPQPPIPRTDPAALSGPPPKRRRPADDTGSDDSERMSGGPPPKRRKK